MASQKSKSSAKKVPCVACSAHIDEGLVFCDICGAPQKELPPCPHCRGRGGVELDDEFLLVCKLCGGPRVPVLPGEYEPSGRERAPLAKAETARKKRGLWRAGAVVAGSLVPFAGIVTLLMWWLLGTAVGLLSTAFFVAPLLLVLWFAIGRSKRHQAAIGPLLDQAWTTVAADVADQFEGALTATKLGKILDVDQPRAEQLLAQVGVEETLSSGARVTVAPDPRFAKLEEEQRRLSVAKTQIADDELPDAGNADEAENGEAGDGEEGLGRAASQRRRERAAIDEAIAEAEAEAEADLASGSRATKRRAPHGDVD